jgi:hypothetical protein
VAKVCDRRLKHVDYQALDGFNSCAPLLQTFTKKGRWNDS